MHIINPYMSAARRSGEPDENAARSRKSLQRQAACRTDLKKYRLHYSETPVGMVISAPPMEVHAWNKNARAYYAHQITLGREMLPILEWKEVGQQSESLVWKVVYRRNGNEGQMLVSALTKAGAKREAENMLSVDAVIKTVEQDDDIKGAIQAARAMNGGIPDEDEDEDD